MIAVSKIGYLILFRELGVSNRLLVEGLGKDSQAEASVWKYLPTDITPTFTTIGHRGYAILSSSFYKRLHRFSQIAFRSAEQATAAKRHIETYHPYLRVKFVPVVCS